MTRWRPLADAPFGVEVLGGCDAVTPAELRALLAAHHLIVMSAELSDAQHIALISNFGRVLPQGPRVVVDDRSGGDHPIVTHVSNQTPGAGLGDFELLFHHDMAHVATPLAGLSLHALDMAPGQAPTRFADGAAALSRLPAAEQARLRQLQGLFIGNYTTISDRSVPARAARNLVEPNWPHAVHPVVVDHPVTGVPCVYVNEMQTICVLGLSTAHSDALLDELFGLLYDSANVYEHHWQPGQLVVWDNLVLQHSRPPVTDPSPRVLRRVVFGERTPWEEWPASPAH